MRHWTLLLVACAVAACSKTPLSPLGPSAGSETHWLTACTQNADCESAVGAACLCGVCTRTCDEDADCDSTGLAAACMAAEDPALVDACGGVPPERALCVATCAVDAECGARTVCTERRCLPGERVDFGFGGAAGAGGAGGAGGAAGGAVPPPRSQTITVPARPKMDILMVVDNSGSMCEEQGLLADALRTASPTLAELDLRFAVVSTDLRTPTDRGAFLTRPAAPDTLINCAAAGGPASPDTSDCGPALAAVDVRDGVLRADGAASAEVLAAAARCLVTLGTTGDGFEKGLEAMRLALACDGPQAALFGACCRDGHFDRDCAASPAFLRPDAGLLVVIVSDETDCSDPASNAAASRTAICRYGPADTDGDSVPDGYGDPTLCPGGDPGACLVRECGGRAPEACYQSLCLIDRGDNNNCLWHREALTPVSEYIDFLRGLKRRAGLDVRVLPIVGRTPRLPTGEALTWTPGIPESACDPAGADFDPEADAARCCPAGQCTGNPYVVCQSERGNAFTGSRYRELARGFCDPDGRDCDALDQTEICDGGFELGASLNTVLTHVQRVFCLDVRPLPGEALEVLQGDRPLAAAEYALEDNPACPGGRALRLINPEPGATYLVRVLP